MVHMERGDAVPELSKGVPETRGVRAAGDEAGDLGTGLDQVAPTDEVLDSCS